MEFVFIVRSGPAISAPLLRASSLLAGPAVANQVSCLQAAALLLGARRPKPSPHDRCGKINVWAPASKICREAAITFRREPPCLYCKITPVRSGPLPLVITHKFFMVALGLLPRTSKTADPNRARWFASRVRRRPFVQ